MINAEVYAGLTPLISLQTGEGEEGQREGGKENGVIKATSSASSASSTCPPPSVRPHTHTHIISFLTPGVCFLSPPHTLAGSSSCSISSVKVNKVV